MGSLLWLTSPLIHAMIDPGFTPVHLVEDSQRIIAGRLREDGRRDRWVLAELRVLKGEKTGRPRLSLDLPRARDAEHAREFLSSGLGSEAVFFQGGYRGIETGYLLVKNVWVRLKPAGGSEWRISGFNDQRMLKTYYGAADKLIEMTEYILRDEEADVPVSVGVAWQRCVTVARFPQPVTGMAALASRGALGARLFAASPAGDRLFAYDERKGRFEDRTEAGGLDTASRAFALADLNGDGRSDLVSWDGARLGLRIGRQDGGFGPLQESKEPEWRGKCSALAAISPYQDGSPGLLLGAEWPHLLAWSGKDWLIAPLPGEEARYVPAGENPCCVAADWDGDGYADVLQLREKESLLWKGKDGGFEEPRPCGVRSGGSRARWSVGDFDADGRPDLFVSGGKASELWENAGGGTFRPVIRYAGSLQFKDEPGAADCLATDLNHDGRPDLALLYEKGHFLYHFNRGYRCMAEEGELKLDAEQSGRKSSKTFGPVRAAAGDFNADGSLDLAVAFNTGEVLCFLNDLSEMPGLWIRLPRGRTGPVTVSVWQGAPHAFCVGTYLVAGHAPPTYVSLRKRGPCVLRWRWPGGPPRELAAEEGTEVMLPFTSIRERSRRGRAVGEMDEVCREKAR